MIKYTCGEIHPCVTRGRQCDVLVANPLAWDSIDPGSGPKSTVYLLSDFGQITSPLCLPFHPPASRLFRLVRV